MIRYNEFLFITHSSLSYKTIILKNNNTISTSRQIYLSHIGPAKQSTGKDKAYYYRQIVQQKHADMAE